MDQLIINSYEEFAAYEGKQLGASEWLQVDQDRINSFADATLDHQWIHVDTARAAEESPTRAPSPTATLPSRFCPTCGMRSSRSTT